MYMIKYPDIQYMVDIETTGTGDDDKIIQIALVPVMEKNGYLTPFWSSKRKNILFFNFYQHVDHEPKTEWAKKHQADLYKKCMNTVPSAPEKVREMILGFFKEAYNTAYSILNNFDDSQKAPIAKMIGKNASSFDLPRLSKEGYLQRMWQEEGPDGKQIEMGDYHYRVEELTGYILGMCRATGLDQKTIEKTALAIYPEVELPKDLELHDGLYDCFMQIRLYNGLIRMQRLPGKVV